MNGIAPHPWLPILGVCGIDQTAKIFETGDKSTPTEPVVAQETQNEDSFNEESEDEEDPFIEFLHLIRVWQRNARARANQNENDEENQGNREDEDEQTNENVNSNEQTNENANSTPNSNVAPSPTQRQPSSPTQSAKEILDQATSYRKTANDLFSAGVYEGAIELYNSALDKLSQVDNAENDNSVLEARILCILNKAACYLKLDQNEQAINCCDEILRLQPNNLKALYRKARALHNLSRYVEAREILLALIKSGYPDENIKNLHEQNELKITQTKKSE